jgi:hypothetical protein
MTETRETELTKDAYRDIANSAFDLATLIRGHMSYLHEDGSGYRIPDEWHELADWAGLASLIGQAAHRIMYRKDRP